MVFDRCRGLRRPVALSPLWQSQPRVDTDTNGIPKPQHIRLLPCAREQVFALHGALHAVDDATIKALRATLEQRRPKPYHGIIVLMDPDVAGRQGVDPSLSVTMLQFPVVQHAPLGHPCGPSVLSVYLKMVDP